MLMKRKQHGAKFKFTVALEAAKGTKTVNEVASAFGVHPSQVSQWKRQMLDAGPSMFNGRRSRADQEQANKETELYEQIGRLKMEPEWLKKKASQFD
jgi:transposase-like protein